MGYESASGPINHRDASNTSASLWKNAAPTPISVPLPGQRLAPVPPGEHSQRPLRPHDNPYSRITNNLSPHFNTNASSKSATDPDKRSHPPPNTSRPGNPNVRQTLLAKAADERSFSVDLRARKRQKLDLNIFSTTNGASSSYASRPTVSEPDVQLVEMPRASGSRSNFVPNDAEIIDLGASSDDLGEPVPRIIKSSSPDPICFLPEHPIRASHAPRVAHAFETHPTKYETSASDKGKSRAKDLPEFVEGSEEEDEISEFTPPLSNGRPPDVKNTRGIPADIVQERKRQFESVGRSAPAAIRHPPVISVDLTTGSVVRRMKKKDEGAPSQQRSTGISDLGISSSNFVNSSRAKEKNQTLPLQAWCLGQHFFGHSEAAPIKLTYESLLQKVRVTWGRSPPEKFEFKLDRDVCSVMIVNDPDNALKENVVVQFTTTAGSSWKEAERKYKGFQGGGARGRDVFTFLISTEKHRGFSITDYQKFVTEIRKAIPTSAVEIIQPGKGKSIWDYTCRICEMFELSVTRNTIEAGSESVLDKPPPLTRSATPCSSATVKIGPELKPSDGDSASSSVPHRRSARQSAMRAFRASPPPPPQAQLEPDEVVLIYPPSGTGALHVMHSDLRRLQPEEYLNDTLIEFGLKLWLNDLREKDPTLADQIHVFSSFFYKKLHNKKNPEDGYKSVRKWTSKVNLFTKKYIIVPINENIHWYLAIIYEPGHTLEPPFPSSQHSDPRTTRNRKQKQDHAKAGVSLERLSPAVHVTDGENEVDTSSVDATRATTPSTTNNQDMDDAAITVFDKSCSITTGSEPVSTTYSEVQIRDSSPNLVHPPSDGMDVDGDTPVPDTTRDITEVQHSSTSKLSSGVPVSQFYGGNPGQVVLVDNDESGEDQQQEAEVDDMLAVTQSPTGDLPAQTYIFTLDSLGTRHPQAIKVLKQYLEWEARDKCNFDEVRAAVGKQVQVPVQPNTWDCGAYLLHFVKVFMNAPSDVVEQILTTKGTMPSSERKKMWEDHEVPQFRDYLQSRIVQLSEEWNAGKTERGEQANKQSDDTMEVGGMSSEGEVDIVEDVPSVKATSRPRQKQRQPAKRLRG